MSIAGSQKGDFDVGQREFYNEDPTTGVSSRTLMRPLATSIERNERRPLRLSGYAVREDGSCADLTVIDLSYDGCGIECSTDLRPGETIRLGVTCRGAIVADVRWYEGGKAGLVFTPEPQPDTGPVPRQSERVAVTADVSVRRRGRHSYRVRVYDASMHGCRIEFAEKPQAMETLRITFDGLAPLEARVHWVDEHCAGLKFSNPIHPAVFELVAERLRQAA